MSKLSKSDIALLQARHAYNDAVVQEVIDGGGYTVGKDTLVIKFNRMAWGLFEQSILNAFKDRPDLCQRNPELVAQDTTCPECKGVGRFPFSDEENEKAIAENNEGLDPSDPFYSHPGTLWAKFCSPCQGTGFILKKQR